ncbi:MAG: DNA primase [Burkholderiaceae bacterium]
MIPESFIQDLLARVDVVDVVGRYVQLRKGGANLLGLCPFHNEKTPSFTVSPTKQFYHCFGCGAHGTAITFLTQHTGASFPEAIRTLAGTVGMVVPEAQRSPRQRQLDQQRKQEISRHEQVLETARRHYLNGLKRSPQAIDYLKSRGLSGEIAARFGLGWSGTDRRGLTAVFADYEDHMLVECGLVIEAEDGRRYDRFRERIMFPIHNARGKLVGFGGRIIGKGEPKYLNSPETPLFSKGRELYGLWESRAGIRREACVLVVEGYMDVVGLAQHGMDNAVATLGTSTTPEHVQKLLRASHKIVFSYDGDTAGRRAAWRALQACLPQMRDDVSLRFLFLPAEHDPDSYIRAYGDKAFRATMDEAVPLSRFMMDELASRHRLDEAEGRAACVHEAIPLLASLPQNAYRLQLEREFARLVLLTPEELTGLLEGAPAQQRSSEPPWVSGPTRFEETSASPGPDPRNEDGMLHAGLMSGPVTESFPAMPSNAGRGQKRSPNRGGTRHSVTPMAKQLLRLLIAHPQLVAGLGDQQLEILERGPHLTLVRELIALVAASGARHAGALLQAAEPDSDLEQVLSGLGPHVLAEDDLPDPQAEWNDALRRIELDMIKAEQTELAQAGLKDAPDQRRYQD